MRLWEKEKNICWNECSNYEHSWANGFLNSPEGIIEMAADSIGACWKWPHWATKHFSCSRKVTSRQKALTRDFAPYCFSTFSRSCLKQASKRSWKGLSASVTFCPWMRTPSARCGIWRGQNIKCEKPSSNITGWGVWEVSYMSVLYSLEEYATYIQFNAHNLWSLGCAHSAHAVTVH